MLHPAARRLLIHRPAEALDTAARNDVGHKGRPLRRVGAVLAGLAGFDIVHHPDPDLVPVVDKARLGGIQGHIEPVVALLRHVLLGPLEQRLTLGGALFPERSPVALAQVLSMTGGKLQTAEPPQQFPRALERDLGGEQTDRLLRRQREAGSIQPQRLLPGVVAGLARRAMIVRPPVAHRPDDAGEPARPIAHEALPLAAPAGPAATALSAVGLRQPLGQHLAHDLTPQLTDLLLSLRRRGCPRQDALVHLCDQPQHALRQHLGKDFLNYARTCHRATLLGPRRDAMSPHWSATKRVALFASAYNWRMHPRWEGDGGETTPDGGAARTVDHDGPVWEAQLAGLATLTPRKSSCPSSP